ncbi:hypothetical protein OG780_28700 [Streptomyces sp. NBC_00386]|uniref:hypothetical protein n=1 Tax=Streptomyces sp. NBC_00386 TaxID=2975734 RepID=UPI002E1B0A17
MFLQCIEVVGAPVLIVGGVATLGGGWLPALYRSSVRRPVMFGWAQLTAGAGLAIYLVGAPSTNTPHLDLAVKTFGTAVWVFGLALAGLAEREPRRR